MLYTKENLQSRCNKSQINGLKTFQSKYSDRTVCFDTTDFGREESIRNRHPPVFSVLSIELSYSEKERNDKPAVLYLCLTQGERKRKTGNQTQSREDKRVGHTPGNLFCHKESCRVLKLSPETFFSFFFSVQEYHT